MAATPVVEDGDPAANAVLTQAHRKALLRHPDQHTVDPADSLERGGRKFVPAAHRHRCDPSTQRARGGLHLLQLESVARIPRMRQPCDSLERPRPAPMDRTRRYASRYQ
jgi:hypothetical protein